MIAKAHKNGDGKIPWDEFKFYGHHEWDKSKAEAMVLNSDGNIDQTKLSAFDRNFCGPLKPLLAFIQRVC